MENSDDTAVLQRIASTPLPHRKHRLHNMLKSVLIQDYLLSGSTASPGSREDAECAGMSKSSKKSVKLRHSMTDVLETSATVETIPLPSQPVKVVTTSERTEEEEEDKGQSSLTSYKQNEDKEVKADESNKTGSDDPSKSDTSLAIEPDGDKETLEEIASTTSHLNKSVSSASDTPSQKSSSSASSSTKQKTETSLPVDGKFSSFSRFSIPSNTAMISSNLTTTPKSRAIVFASAGKGYIPWNSSARGDGSPDKPCLLLWMC